MGNRMLRDWTDSEKVNSLTVHAERFFTRLIMKVDDYGCFHADVRLLKANLCPLLLDVIREADISRWMAEAQTAGLIVLYESSNKRYLQILDFRQRLDKARAKFPLPDSELSLTTSGKPLTTSRDFRAEVEPEVEEEISANASVGETPPDVKALYRDLSKTNENLYRFILSYKPTFAEPYVAYWNLFAEKFKKAQVASISDERRKKIAKRLTEPLFNFMEILRNAGKSEKLCTDANWFSFDWIIKNEGNYLKVLEGNYANVESVKDSSESELSNLQKQFLAAKNK